jgi:hypothetical protein
VIMMWALFARDFRPGQWLLVLAAVVLAIDAGLWFWDTGIYGTSGFGRSTASWRHAFGARARGRCRRLDSRGLIVLKLGYEPVERALPFSDSDVRLWNARIWQIGRTAAAQRQRLI